jgi:uncharacterized protein with PIN domain
MGVLLIPSDVWVVFNIHAMIAVRQGFARKLYPWYAPSVAQVEIRFYQELNEFLPPALRARSWPKSFAGTPSVKDLIESCGVPHVEVDLVLVDGVSVGWGHGIRGGERIAVYPVFEGLDISPVQRLRPKPLREPRFIVDANLGRLARLLRLLGFDATYDTRLDDAQIVNAALAENRIILTRDRGLLMRKIVTHGYYVRNHRPRAQASEVLERLDLRRACRPFSRCASCNGVLTAVDVNRVRQELPPRTRPHVTAAFRCADCGQLYWKGSHWPRLVRLIRELSGVAVAE